MTSRADCHRRGVDPSGASKRFLAASRARKSGNYTATGLCLPSINAVLQTATLPLGYPAVFARNERNVRAERVNAMRQSCYRYAGARFTI